MTQEARRPCLLYGLASSRDKIVRYLGQTRDGIQQAAREHIADARRSGDEFDCSDWLRKEILAGFRLVAVAIGPGTWDETLQAEVKRRKAAGEPLVNRPPDLEAIPKESPAIPVTDQARANMSIAAKRRYELSAGTRGAR